MDRRQIKIHITKTKHNPEKANNTKQSQAKLSWFSRLIWHSARKRGGLILPPDPTRGISAQMWLTEVKVLQLHRFCLAQDLHRENNYKQIM